MCKSTKAELSEVSEEGAGDHQEEVLSMQGQFFSISVLVESPQEYLHKKQEPNRMRRLNHHACTPFGKWVPSKVEAHPWVEVTLRLAREDYKQVHLPEPKEGQMVKMQAVTDTEAIMVVVGVKTADLMKIKRPKLFPVELKISATNNSKMFLLGAAPMEIYGQAEDGSVRKSKQLVYVSGGVAGIFLSQQVCRV